MKRIILSLVTIVTVAAIATGATVAYFSDTETSNSNTFAAGTLDLKVDNQDDSNIVHVTLNNMKPGQTASYQWNWKNNGTIDGKPWMQLTNVVDNDNGLLEPEQVDGDTTDGIGGGELSQYLLMKLNAPGSTGYAYPNQSECFDSGSKCPLSTWDNYSQIGQSPWEVWQTIAAGATNDPMVLEFELPSTVGNVVQSDTVTFDLVFHLDQVTP